MTFIAKVRHHSLVWKNWHGAARPSGVLQDIVFRWEPGHTYRSGLLTPEQVTALQLHPDIELEMVAVSLPELDETPITEPAIEVAPEKPEKSEKPATKTKAEWDRLAKLAKSSARTK